MFSYKEVMRHYEWEQGRIINLVQGSYRHRVDVLCDVHGRSVGFFRNGAHPYVAYIRMLHPDHTEISDGNCIVPVLPDHRFLMVYEYRPNLNPDGVVVFAPSLEFPGGSVYMEEVAIGCLRECREETGVPHQKAVLYKRRAVNVFSSDIVCYNHCCVLFLTEGKFEVCAPIDGGLKVVAMSRDEVNKAMWDGTITHGSSHLAWHFYNEIRLMHPICEEMKIANGDMTKTNVWV